MFGNKEETLEVFCGEDSSKGELKDDTEVVGNLIVQCIQRELDAYQRAHLHRKRYSMKCTDCKVSKNNATCSRISTALKMGVDGYRLIYQLHLTVFKQ